MDSGTSNHPPCPMCDPSILPEGYDPIDAKSVMVRPDGSLHDLRGAVKVYLDGVDVTNQAEQVDAERGVVVAFHRILGKPPITAAQAKRGETNADKAPEMVRHMCNRDGLERYDPRLAGAHACRMVLYGQVSVIDKATGVAPVFWDREDVGSAP